MKPVLSCMKCSCSYKKLYGEFLSAKKVQGIVPFSQTYGSLLVVMLQRGHDQQQRLLGKSNKSFVTTYPTQLRLFVCFFIIAFFYMNIAIANCVCELGSFFSNEANFTFEVWKYHPSASAADSIEAVN